MEIRHVVIWGNDVAFFCRLAISNYMIDDIYNIKHTLLSLGIPVNNAHLFKDGTLQSTYKIKSEKGLFVVKLFNKDREKFIKQEITRLREIHQYSDLTIYPLHRYPLWIGNKIAYYYKFFNGKKLSVSKTSNVHYKFGKLAGLFDLVLQKLVYNKREFSFNKILESCINNISVNNYSTGTAEWIRKGQELFKQEFNHKDFSRIRIQFIHKDLHFDNVLYNKTLDRYFIIDTGGLSLQFLPRELAVIIGKEFVGKGNKIRHNVIHGLLRGYNEFVKFSKIEAESIPLFIIEKKIGELIFLNQQYKNNNISKKIFDKYQRLSLRNLKVAVNHYEELVKFLGLTINLEK